MIAAIDQHIADAAGAHFAEGDFLFVASVLELAGSWALCSFRRAGVAGAQSKRAFSFAEATAVVPKKQLYSENEPSPRSAAVFLLVDGLAASGPMPPAMSAVFTVGEHAVLVLLRCECESHH